MKAEICEGEYCLPSAVTQASPLAASNDLVRDEAHVLLGHGVFERPADEALDREEGPLGIGDGLAFGGLADEPLAVVRESDDGGGRPRALRILDDLGRRAFHNRDAGIRRAKVDADYFSHRVPLFFARSSGPEATGPERTTPNRPDLAVELLLIPSCSSVAADAENAISAAEFASRAVYRSPFLATQGKESA